MVRPRLSHPEGYLLGSYLSATAPEPNSSRLTTFKSRCFDSPANNVGPWPATLGVSRTRTHRSIPAPSTYQAFSCERQSDGEAGATSSSAATPCWAALRHRLP